MMANKSNSELPGIFQRTVSAAFVCQILKRFQALVFAVFLSWPIPLDANKLAQSRHWRNHKAVGSRSSSNSHSLGQSINQSIHSVNKQSPYQLQLQLEVGLPLYVPKPKSFASVCLGQCLSNKLVCFPDVCLFVVLAAVSRF